MKPNIKNFCGGSFSEWLAVNLLSECNAKCKFCIERKEGHVFQEHKTWQELGDIIVKSDKKKVMLLGGEPTLYEHLPEIINHTKSNTDKQVFLTTNGYVLNESYVKKNLLKLDGISISICHYDMDKNQEIYGLKIDELALRQAINLLKFHGIPTRVNCNLLRGYIDNKGEINKMIEFSKRIGAEEIRISETFSDDEIIKLEEIFNYEYGTNSEPFEQGCLHTAIIDGYKVVLRQCCGLETSHRIKPSNPEVDTCNDILYYNGEIYSGWIKKDTKNLNPVIIRQFIKSVIKNKLKEMVSC